jgi:hypothetical protein
MLRFLGVFVPIVRENMEMLYQFEYDYRFDSGNSSGHSGFRPRSIEKGLPRR